MKIDLNKQQNDPIREKETRETAWDRIILILIPSFHYDFWESQSGYED